jgi:type IV secretory pathway TrbF-like protein
MFRRPTVRYGDTPPAETPYMRARQAWDDRIGSAAVQAKNWRVAFFGTLVLSGAMAAGWYWQSARGTVVPWVVQIDKLGDVQAVGPAAAEYRPGDPIIGRELANFIKNVRNISTDTAVVRQDWLDAYKYLTDKGKLALNDYAQHNDPFAKIGKEQVVVEVTSVIRASDQSFRIAWVEKHYTDGALAATERWTAIVTIVVQPPHDITNLNLNPLGIYIDAINWSKELG